jgi:hypothetical protein
MTKSTNTNAPQTDYTNCIDKWGAAFRDSITCDQVRQKLQHATYIDRFNAIISKKPKRGAGNKDFQTDPWSAYAAAGKTGREWDLDGGKVWRLIRFTGCWFLARHTGGFNDFEYWHIGDVSSGSATCYDTKNPATTPPMPALTQPTPIPTINAPGATTTVLLPASELGFPQFHRTGGQVIAQKTST